MSFDTLLNAATRNGGGLGGGVQLPWAGGWLGYVLGENDMPGIEEGTLRWAGPVPPDPGAPASSGTTSGADAAEGPGLQATGSTPTWHAAVRGGRTLKRWQQQQEEERRAALGLWLTIARCAGASSVLWRQLEAVGPDSTQAEATLENTFRQKATGTLLRRGGSMAAFLRWAAGRGAAAFPLTEEILYEYLEQLRMDRAPATKASSMLEAVPFTITLLGLGPGTWADLNTQRVKGAALGSYDRKRLTRKAPPLTARAVKLMEEGVSKFSSVEQRVLAGDICFLVHGRLRCADAARIAAEPTLDVDDDGVGFIDAEIAGGDTKAGGGRRKRRLTLPIAADANGLTGAWAATWLEQRRRAGLNASVDGVLLCAVDGAGKFYKAKRPTATMSAIMRELLAAAGVAEAKDYSSRSCKATCLSWAAKYGLKEGTRRMLGGHCKPKDLSMLEYSRDSLAPGLRELRTVYDAIIAGKFEPDVTRSGRFRKTVEDKPEQHDGSGALETQCVEVGSSSSSSEPSEEEPAQPDQEALADAAVACGSLGRQDESVLKLWGHAESLSRVVKHPRWHTQHILAESAGALLLCKRAAGVYTPAPFNSAAARCLRCTSRWHCEFEKTLGSRAKSSRGPEVRQGSPGTAAPEGAEEPGTR